MCEVQNNRLFARDVELTKRTYLHPDATASTYTTATAIIIATSITTTATKGLAATINSTATTTAAIMTRDIMVKKLGYVETLWD